MHSYSVISESPSQLQPENALRAWQRLNPSDDTNWEMLCPELIYEILTYCFSGATLSVCSPRTFPWYLGHICRSWRSVFISSPRFWDRFSFEWMRRAIASAPTFERALALVQLCIERTKDCTFSFHFKANMYIMEARQSLYAIRILETLVAHANRWRAAYFITDRDRLQESLTKAKGHFGQLRTLQICIVFGVSCHDHIASDLFKDAPNPTRVCATGYHRLRWSSVTVLHFEYESDSAYGLFAGFEQMTSLEELVIKVLSFCHDLANVPVELPSLKTIAVDLCFPLSLIKAPSLERLYLTDSPLDDDIQPIKTFLRGVNHLNTLSLDVVHSVDCATIIDCAPEPDHLITAGRWTNTFQWKTSMDVLRSLASRSAARSLKKITVGIRTPYFTSSSVSIMHQLTNIVESWEKRQFPRLRLLSVYVDHRGEDMTSAVGDLIRLGADKGLEVDIISTPFPMVLPFGDW